MNPGPTDGAEKSEPQPAAYGSTSWRFGLSLPSGITLGKDILNLGWDRCIVNRHARWIPVETTLLVVSLKTVGLSSWLQRACRPSSPRRTR